MVGRSAPMLRWRFCNLAILSFITALLFGGDCLEPRNGCDGMWSYDGPSVDIHADFSFVNGVESNLHLEEVTRFI